MELLPFESIGNILLHISIQGKRIERILTHLDGRGALVCTEEPRVSGGAGSEPMGTEAEMSAGRRQRNGRAWLLSTPRSNRQSPLAGNW